MPRLLFVFTLCYVTSIAFALRAADEPAPSVTIRKPIAIDYQSVIDHTPWTFELADANPLANADQMSAYTTKITCTPPHSTVHIEIFSGEHLVHAWDGNSGSAFIIDDDRLIYPIWSQPFPKVSLVAIDLKSGTSLWRSELHGFDTEVLASCFATCRFTLSRADDVLMLRGDSNYGRFLECVEPLTGQTMGHRIYDSDQPPTAK